MKILLVEPEYYTQYPPIPLLKLSAYHKERGDEIVGLVRGCSSLEDKPDRIYVTSLWTWAWREVWKCVRYYKTRFPFAEVWLGGLYASILYEHAVQSGADHVYVGVFEEAEDLLPDYGLLNYSEKWRGWDGSIVFSSRGCPFECGYCFVPKIEGKINSVKYSIKHLIYPKHTKIIFFDNNILASPGWRSIFDELEELKLKVDFNQGLDARFINDEVAERLSRLKFCKMIRLAYDHKGVRKWVKRAIDLLSEYKIKKRNIMVYTLYNFTDDPEDLFTRIRDLLEWGVVAYPMRYQPPTALKKNSYVAPKWDSQRLELVQRFRRVVGYGGALPPYYALVDKFRKASCFDEAFSLRPARRE